jgi:hypothetical protein
MPSKISGLTAVVTPASTDEFEVNQGGTSKKETRAQIHALQSGEHLVLPQVNEAATPTLAFGDGDSGFYEQSDDNILVSTAGSAKWQIGESLLGCVTGGRATIRNVATTDTVAGLLPDNGDLNTGIGSAAADQLSLIAGGFELLRLADTAPNATLTATVDAASTELLKLVGPTRATSADDDEIYVGFYLDVDDGVEEMGRLTLLAEDVTTATEDSRFEFGLRKAAGAASITDWYMKQDIFYGSQGGRIYNETASDTNPTLVPTSDADTGIGSAAADQLSLIAGALEVIRCDGTVGTKGQVLLPQEDIAATPTLAFGDGNTGFYEASDNNLKLSIANQAKWLFDASSMASETTSGALLTVNAGAATVPAHAFRGDGDTGIGRAAADQLSLIAGGIEALRITEASSINTFDFDAGDNVAPQVGARWVR